MNDDYSIKDLDKSARKARQAHIKALNSNYRYARSLGFNSYEAGVLRGRDKETIRRLAIEKGLIKDDGKPKHPP